MFLARSGLSLLLPIALLSAPGPGVAAEPPSIDFVVPRNQRTVLGPSEVELALHVPEGARVRQVVVSVDGKQIGKLRAAPWKLAWDAGDGDRAHLLEAVLVLEDGTEARAFVRTSALRIDAVAEVALVNMYAVVRDRKGEYVQDLTAERFRITENSRPQTIERFSTDWKPLRVAIVLDTSLSMKEDDKLDNARQAAISLVESLHPEDQGMVVSFSDSVKVLQPFTSDHAALAAAIQSTQAKGGTALYDALWRTADAVGKVEGRRVIVLLSDGKDEAASGLEPGSLHTEEEALDRVLRAEAMIFSIGIGRNLAQEWDFARRRSLEAILREMSETTGGRTIISTRVGKLRAAFAQIYEDLRHQYSLAYRSDDTKHDGAWREVRLTTDRPDLVLITRKGYFAPREPPPRTQ